MWFLVDCGQIKLHWVTGDERTRCAPSGKSHNFNIAKSNLQPVKARAVWNCPSSPWIEELPTQSRALLSRHLIFVLGDFPLSELPRKLNAHEVLEFSWLDLTPSIPCGIREVNPFVRSAVIFSRNLILRPSSLYIYQVAFLYLKL